jgi:HlyD family secretion protein
MRRIAAVLGVLTLILVGLLAARLHAQEAALHGPPGGSGEIEGTEVRVASKLLARVVEQAVHKGDSVKQGALLVRLDCTDPQQALAEAQARLASAEATVKAAQAQVAVAGSQQQALTRSVAAAEAQAESLVAQRDASRRQAARLDAVADDVAFSSRDQVRSSAVGLEYQVTAARASGQVSAEQAKAAGGQARAAVAQAESAEMAVRVAQTAVERAQVLVSECELKAPRDAEVEEVFYEAGELVGPGVVVVKLIDLREAKATFYLPNAEVGAIRPGMKATVVADALPDERFTGTVRTVSLQAEFTPRNIQTRTDRDRLVYPVEVAIANPGLKLRAGMPVQVTLAER